MKPLFRLLSTSLLIIILTQRLQAGCGNDIKDNPCPSCSFIAYNGSETRQMLDLEVKGGVGEIPLQWVRHYYSRSFKQTYSFLYYLVDAGMDEQGRSKLEFLPPEGGYSFGTTFTQSKNDPSLWLPLPGVNERLFQQGNNFFLQRGNGHRYRFEKINISAGTFYYLQDIRDNYQNVYKLTYDNNYNLASVTEPAGRYLKMTYSTIDGHDYLADVAGSDGRSVKYNYDIYNDGVSSWVRLINVSYGDNTNATYSYGQPLLPNQQPNTGLQFLFLEHAIDPRLIGTGVNMRFTYDHTIAGGYIKEERNGLTNEVMTTLNTSDGNRWICHANGKVEHLVVPAELQGDVKERIDGLGRSTKYTYENGNGFLEKEIDPLGRVTSYIRTIYGNPVEITHPDGFVEKWTRDDLDQVLTHTDELGRVTTYVRDDRHRITRIQYPDGATEGFTYNDFGQVLTHTLRNGGTESNTYDNRGLKTASTDALGNITSYAYDGADRLASVIDANGNTIKREYNERGLVVKVINSDNSFQTYTYDNDGNQTSVTNEIGYTWKVLFDEFKRPISATDPLNRVTKYSYDLPGGGCGCSHDKNYPTQIIGPNGRVTKFEYDIEWKKTRQIIGAGSNDAATTLYEYDLVDNLKAEIDALGRVWTYTYDVRDRRKLIVDPLGNKVEYNYDAVGNVIETKRADNGIITYLRNNMNWVTQITDQKGQVTMINYDKEGKVIRMIDPGNRTYEFEYNLLERQTKTIYPNNSAFETYSYDPAGNIKMYTNRAGNVLKYTYDSRNRMINATWSDNTPALTFSYDAANRPLTLSSSISLLSYTYNNANELTSEVQDIAGAGESKKVTYIYSDEGQRSGMIYPGGTTINYDYTGREQIKSIIADGSTLVTYNYDLDGNRISKTLQNGTSTIYTYDGANRVLSLDNLTSTGSFAKLQYGYDNVHRKTFVKRNNDKGDVYSYDAVDQITNVQYEVANPDGVPSDPTRIVDYDWDALGNRSSVNDNNNKISYTINNLNQYTKINDTPLTYNANGALSDYDGWRYTYDAQDRLIKAEKLETTIDFAYDGLNRCVKRLINGVATYFYYNGWNLIEERNSSNALLTRYIHGSERDELLSKSSVDGIVYYHQDALENVINLTDAKGNVLEQYAYDIFGTTIIRNANGEIIESSNCGNRFMFSGREYIQEAGLYDYRNRIYSSKVGRFLQIDPIRFNAGDENFYRYVSNSPVNITDPFGLFTCVPRLIGGVTVDIAPIYWKRSFWMGLQASARSMAWDDMFAVEARGTAFLTTLVAGVYFYDDEEQDNVWRQGQVSCECIKSTKECKISVNDAPGTSIGAKTSRFLVLEAGWKAQIAGDEAKITLIARALNTGGVGGVPVNLPKLGSLGIGNFPTGMLGNEINAGNLKYKCMKE